jgi:phosphatidate cytidylyltransferase
MSFRKRLPTSLIMLAAVFVSIQYLSDLGFFIAIQALILAALLEFYNLASKREHSPQRILGFVLALIIAFSFFMEALPLGLALFVCLLVTGVYFVLEINKLEKLKVFPPSIALTVFGAVYLSFMLNHIYYLRREEGPFLIYFLLAVIFIGDTGAYVVGTLMGRHKMAPLASPKKTWEGSFAGVITACLGGIAAQQILLPDVALWNAALFASLIHVVAQVSDPLESLFKRAAGVKDSSHILPGHGGFLDRVDSLILAVPFFYYLLEYVGMS